MASIKKAEDYYRTSLIWEYLGKKDEAKKFYNMALTACDGFPPIYSDEGFENSLFVKMAILQRALNFCK